jgi:4-amino-4-deoxy-L-arabinose transferase-like glycosyltransferase
MNFRKFLTSLKSADPSPRNASAEMSWPLAFVLVLGLVVRALHLGQPIVENYVGRQIPTAMVARNLEKGLEFLRPQLDTAPFPNYFVVEPPIYQGLVVGLRTLTGWPLEACGRLISNLATVLGAWGVFLLVDRRAGRASALAAAAAFSMLPVTIRYGRAFQPDALMLGACTAGLACWDRATSRDRRWLAAGWLLMAIGLAVKVIAAFLLPVAVLAVFRTQRLRVIAFSASTLIPALLWYLWADHLMGDSTGSRASAENRAIWMRLIGLGALAHGETWAHIVRFLAVRAFTPLGLIVALWGLVSRPRSDREGTNSVWWTWAGFALATMAMLAEKLHHEYYWLCLAPVVAAGLGGARSRLAARDVRLAWGTTLVFGTLCVGFSASTWRTPEEWRSLVRAGEAVAASTPPGDLVVAPEPLLYAANRRGCRLEFTPSAAERAASEWGTGATVGDPLELVEFYRIQGARWVADVGAAAGDARRLALHEGIRRRYKIWMDRPDFLLAELTSDEPLGHAD